MAGFCAAVDTERSTEIKSLWDRYNPAVRLVQKSGTITLNATKQRIECDPRTLDVFWLITYGGWRAIETYSPHVLLSAEFGRTVAQIVADDAEIDDVERDYRERISAAHTLIRSADADAVDWPPDIPRPSSDREASSDPQRKAAFDLSCLAVAFAFFHEFRHVILDHEKSRPADRREEELNCDVWARAFMTEKLDVYAQAHGHDYRDVLRMRSMGIAVAALVLHEITDELDHGGNNEYFSVATRLGALLRDTPLPEDDYFWVFAASLLIGMLRQKHIPVDASSMPPKALAHYLLDKL